MTHGKPGIDAARTSGRLSSSAEGMLLVDRSPATEGDAGFVGIGPTWATAQVGLFAFYGPCLPQLIYHPPFTLIVCPVM